MTSRPHYETRLALADRLTRPATDQAIRHLAVSFGSSILDLGCGIGLHALRLARAAGASGRVVGLDASEEHLARGRASAAAESGLAAARVSFVEGSLDRLPFEDGAFDLVWCADLLWPRAVVEDPVAAVDEVARIIAPGGRLALLYWSGQSLLAGHPELEARLAQAFAARTPYLAGVRPRDHFLRARGWLVDAGLSEATASTFVADLQGPLSGELREALADCVDMLWGSLQRELSTDDWGTFQRLRDPSSPECIFALPDYYGFITYTLITGVRR